MTTDITNNNSELICHHCLKEIEDAHERYFCKACGLSYHDLCWEKENGCAVISCSQKNILLNPLFQSSVPVRELLIHIEYLLNLKKYNEAINECSRILNAEKNNLEAKVYYNRAVSALNIKMKIYESAESSMNKKEYRASAMFLTDYLKYCDKEESEYINSRIRYINELLPTMNRKKVIVGSLYALIIFTFILTIGFLVYRLVYMKEEIEYAEIESQDNFTDIKSMEHQISKYEKFANKYSDGKFKENALDKILKLSTEVANKICESDWRTSLVYLKKIDNKQNPITFKEIYDKVKRSAEKELSALRADARECDNKKKYLDARDRIEKSLALIENFPESEFLKLRQSLYDSKNLLNKKVGLIVKSKDIEKEIEQRITELKSADPEIKFDKILQISGKVMKKSGEYTIIKSFEDKKLYAVKNTNSSYSVGEEIIISGIKGGKAEISDDASNIMIVPIINDISGNDKQDFNSRENIIQRLQYLKGQKERIDSLLNIGI